MCEEIDEAATDPPKAIQKRVHFVGLDDRQIEWSARRGQLHRKILRDQRRHFKKLNKELEKSLKEKSTKAVSMSELSTIKEEECMEKCVYFLCEAHKSIHNPFGTDVGEKQTVSTHPIAASVLQVASKCNGLKEFVTEKTSIDDLPRILLENIQYWDSDIEMYVKFWMEVCLTKTFITLKKKNMMVGESLGYIIDLLPSTENESAGSKTQSKYQYSSYFRNARTLLRPALAQYRI